VKQAGEKSTIGIVFCKQKNKALVEITLPKGANIHARKYQLYLPGKERLRRKPLEWTSEQEVGRIKGDAVVTAGEGNKCQGVQPHETMGSTVLEHL